MAMQMIKSMSTTRPRSDRKEGSSTEEDFSNASGDAPVDSVKKSSKSSSSSSNKTTRNRSSMKKGSKSASSTGTSPVEAEPSLANAEGYWVTDANCEQINGQICETIKTTMAGLWLRYGKKHKIDQAMVGGGANGVRRKIKKVLIYPDGTVLKKPPSAYLLWSKDERKVLKDEKFCDSAETLTVLGDRWQTKTDEEKRPYAEEAARQQEFFEEEKKKCQLIIKPETVGRRGSRKSKASAPVPSGDSASSPAVAVA